MKNKRRTEAKKCGNNENISWNFVACVKYKKINGLIEGQFIKLFIYSSCI